ncbi:MAG: sigma-70 family RNA polymerase sigma factor [Bacilli bacterium]|nr:sigma-70 family RNA polymerase sigma factor [Bacilli bacterium]
MSDKYLKLIKESEGLIYKIASKYSMYYSIDDLYQVGSIGVIKAYKNFKRDTSVKFSTYAYKYILGEIIEFIRTDRNIRVSEEYMSLYKKYLSVKTLLTTRYDREVAFKEICSFMEIDESVMLNIIETISFTKSMDEKDYDYGNDKREEIDNRILLDTELSLMDDFDRQLIEYRYYQGYTQSETADVLGVSQVKVSRQEKLILERMKSNICA